MPGFPEAPTGAVRRSIRFLDDAPGPCDDRVTMDPILEFQALVGQRAAYPLIATVLTFAIKIAKTSPLTKVWYGKIPDGYRFLVPVVAGAAMGFTHGYQQGYTVVGALVEAVFGIFGVSATAMGINAALKESKLQWDGGAGGTKPAPEEPGETPS